MVLLVLLLQSRLGGLRVLFELNHSPLKLCADDKAAGICPAPDVVYTGSYTVTRANVDIFLKRT